MELFAKVAFVVFSLTTVNTWLEKFVKYNSITFSNTKLALYKNDVIYFLSLVGINVILQLLQPKSLPIIFLTHLVNFVCFFVNIQYIFYLLIYIVKEYEGLKFSYNIIMWFCLNYIYFFTRNTHFQYYCIIVIPFLFRAFCNIMTYHYDGNNPIIKILDIYLNYF